MDLESFEMCTQIHTPTVSPNFTADGASTQLIWDRCARIDRESDGATMAGSMKPPKNP